MIYGYVDKTTQSQKKLTRTLTALNEVLSQSNIGSMTPVPTVWQILCLLIENTFVVKRGRKMRRRRRMGCRTMKAGMSC